MEHFARPTEVAEAIGSGLPAGELYHRAILMSTAGECFVNLSRRSTAVLPRSASHNTGERVDERAGGRPPVSVRRLGDGAAFRQVDHRVKDAHVGPPLRVAHAELCPVQPTQRAFAGSNGGGELVQRNRVAEVLGGKAAGQCQTGLVGFRQRQSLHRRDGQSVDDQPAKQGAILGRC